MSRTGSTLVVVAHPGDEALSFSSVCPGADVICCGGGGSEFERSCKMLGARRARSLNLADENSPRLPLPLLAEALDGVRGYQRVYTHSPFHLDSHHRDVALAVSQFFGEVYIEAHGGYATDVHALDRQLFLRKLEIVNSVYEFKIHCFDVYDQSSVPAVAGVESFVRASFAEVARAIATSQPEVIGSVPDVWGFETSRYEEERIARTVELLSPLGSENPELRILELGACEGLMTQRLRELFPRARIRALEANPIFAGRLRERVGQDPLTEVVETSVVGSPLTAELVVAAEVLYYIPKDWQGVLERVEAPYLLTSSYGSFDEEVAECLRRLGWRAISSAEVSPRIEPLDGNASLLLIRRVGTRIKLWTTAGP